MKRRFLMGCASLLVALSCRAQVLAPRNLVWDEPKHNTVFTASREIRALRFVGNDLWAATGGGVLRFNSTWSKWTRFRGLPSNEAFDLAMKDGHIVARFPLHTSIFDGQGWKSNSASPFEKAATTTIWGGQKVVATLDGITIGSKIIPQPPSSGTHISALLAQGKILVAALYGDGLWHFDGKKWVADPLNAKLSEETREITALAGDGKAIFAGTRRAGVWTSQSGYWHPVGAALGAEIYNANIQFLATFQGQLWGSTLDDGLVVKGHDNWGRVTVPAISSTAPRQMLEWKNLLYVRHGNGVVDSYNGRHWAKNALKSYNGRHWAKNALKSMPRQGVYALEGDEKTLYAAGWGGWSEWDGKRWTPFFQVPQLKGVPLMGLLAAGDTLWIATQSRGVGRYTHSSGEFSWLDERNDLPDDWVTKLTKFEGKLYAGTFVGGLARLDGEKWQAFDELKGQNVTALAIVDKTLFAATRSGLWRVEGDTAHKVAASWLDSEVQALWAGKHGLWIGARSSLNFWKSRKVAGVVAEGQKATKLAGDE